MQKALVDLTAENLERVNKICGEVDRQTLNKIIKRKSTRKEKAKLERKFDREGINYSLYFGTFKIAEVDVDVNDGRIKVKSNIQAIFKMQ